MEKGSHLEQMIELFLELDTNKDEMVDKQELLDACEKHKLPPNEVDEWMEKFDTDENGKISLDEFCRGLGLRCSEMRVEKTERQEAKAGKARNLPDGVEIIASTMSQEKKVEITEKFTDLMKGTTGKPEEMNDVVKQLKDYLDQTHGRVWQTVILSGSYWMKFSHEPFMSIQFKVGSHIVLAWRTPSS